MRGRIGDRNIWLVYAAIFVLGQAYGVSISLLALFFTKAGYDKPAIGTLAAAFALGIAALALPMSSVIKKFGARATLIGCIFAYAAMVTALPYTPSFWVLAGVRALDGAASVGVWVSCETILLSRASKENKAFVMSLYANALALGYVVGPLLSRVIVATMPIERAFVAAGVLATIAGTIVLLRLDRDVAHVEGEGESAHGPAPEGGDEPTGSVLWKIKTSCFATFSYGYFQASVVLFLPLYLIEVKGIPEARTLYVPAFFAGGMLLFANVAGRLGDRHGHLFMMRAMGVVGLSMILGFVFLDAFEVMCVLVFVAGATLAAISPVSLALSGSVTRPASLARANGLYNAFYAAGMVLGPPISSRIYGARGGAAMLLHLAAIWACFVAFTIVFRKDDPRARSEAPGRVQ